jgi:tellurite methyltransferase
MLRPITGFGTDAQGDWVAVLSCGHPQHVRHRPPFTLRPWVTSEDGRRSRIGMPLDCVRCDAFELPAGFVVYKHTPIFTETTIPDALRRDHATRAGVWARIVVLEGRLRYTVDTPLLTTDLSPDRPGIVPAESRHRVEPLGPVRFQVEFWAAPAVSAG